MGRQRQTNELPIEVLRGWVVATYRRSWVWCGTLPFPTAVAPDQATELFQVWIEKLEERVKASVPSVTLLELDGTGVVKIYALVAGVESLRYTTGAKDWQQLTGATAGIFAFDPERARQCVLDIAPDNTAALGP